MKRKYFFIIAFLIIVFVVLVFTREKPVDDFFALDTIIHIEIQDLDMSNSNKNKLLKEIRNICEKYENMFSKTVEGSDVSVLNNSKGKSVKVSPETLSLIAKSLEVSEITGGTFDITTKNLSDLWNISSEDPKVPFKDDIEKALQKTGYENIKITGENVTLKNNISIDLGAIAKGYIADKIKEYLLQNGCNSAIINLGGNIVTIGTRPSGEPWKIGIQKPFAPENELIASLSVSNKSVVTSAAYERYFIYGGSLYHHILDPKTGYPSNSNLDSVTIISDNSVDGDALSTACFVMGSEKATTLIESLENVEAIFQVKGGTILKTSGVADKDINIISN